MRSVREQFLASLDPKALLSIEQLNERLWHWLDTVYHRREHSSLAITPLLRWQRDIEQVRQLPPATDMRRLFFHRLDRVVRRTHELFRRQFLVDGVTEIDVRRDGRARRVGLLVDLDDVARDILNVAVVPLVADAG